jgi:hypothetical protein
VDPALQDRSGREPYVKSKHAADRELIADFLEVLPGRADMK